MDRSTGSSVEQFASDFRLEVHRGPFHASEGIELRKVEDNIAKCVGYILGREETTIYKIERNCWDIFASNKLWFFYGWLIRPPKNRPAIITLSVVPSSDFREEDFVKIAKEELGLQ